MSLFVGKRSTVTRTLYIYIDLILNKVTVEDICVYLYYVFYGLCGIECNKEHLTVFTRN